MSKYNELRELTRVRILSFLREPEALFWVFVFPIILAGVLGFAFRSSQVQPVRIGLVSGLGAEQLAEAFAVDDLLEVERYESLDEARIPLRRAAIDAVVEPRRTDEPPHLTIDPTRNEAETARLRILRALHLAREGATDPELEVNEVREAGSRYVDFLFPGLLGMNLMGTGMWGIGFAMADFRRRGFLKRLMVTPMRRSSFFASFMLSRLVFLVLELGVLTAFGAWILGVPFRGDLISFGVVCLVGAIVFAGMGLLIASRARTMQGVSGLMNAVMMPMWLASGVFFSYERFPDAIHPVLKLLPLTALNDALRAVMIDGASVLTLGPEIAVMAVWTAVSFIVALKIFRWE